MAVPGGGDIPATGAGDVPVHLQSNVMPAVQEESGKTLASMDPVTIQQKSGMGISIGWRGELELFDFFCVPSHCNSLISITINLDGKAGQPVRLFCVLIKKKSPAGDEILHHLRI